MIKSYLFLTLAILFEVAGTMLLPVSQNFTKLAPTIGLMFAYIVSFYFLTFALQSIPIGIVYATWAGLGVFDPIGRFSTRFGDFQPVWAELEVSGPI